MQNLKTEISSVLNELKMMEEEYKIRMVYEKLPGYIGGFVYLSTKDRYYIIINENLCFEMQQKVLYHEGKHIVDHLCNGFYICELDEDGQDFSICECTADRFMEISYKEIVNF